MRNYFGNKNNKDLQDKDKLDGFKLNRLTSKEAMAVFAVSRGTLYNWVKKGFLKKFNIGRKSYFFIGPKFNES